MLSAVRPECLNVVHVFDSLERVKAYVLVCRPIMVEIISKKKKVLFATLLTFLSFFTLSERGRLLCCECLSL
jgi:hypothetical protein